MSYGVSAALQAAIYAQLRNDPALAALVGSAIYDNAPPGLTSPGTYVSLGPEDVRAASDATGTGPCTKSGSASSPTRPGSWPPRTWRWRSAMRWSMPR